jgi:hypothetical protein
VEGSCKQGNELLGSVKYWEIPEQLSDWKLLKKGLTSLQLVRSWPQKLHVIHFHSTAGSSTCTKHTLSNVIQYKVLGAINEGLFKFCVLTKRCDYATSNVLFLKIVKQHDGRVKYFGMTMVISQFKVGWVCIWHNVTTDRREDKQTTPWTKRSRNAGAEVNTYPRVVTEGGGAKC